MKFTESHEWIAFQNNIGEVGITDFAQKELGEIVYVELPPVGRKVQKGEPICVLESCKAATDIYAPLSGTIVEINEELATSPSWINLSPQEKGWLFRMQPSSLEEVDELLDARAYETMIY